MLIIGFHAGSLIPEAHGLTHTRAEFQLAQQLGRPVFAFFKTDGGKPLNKETETKSKKRSKTSEAELEPPNITPAYFDTSERLQVELLLAIDKRNADQVAACLPPRRTSFSRSLNPTCLGCSISNKHCAVATRRSQSLKYLSGTRSQCDCHDSA